MESLFTTQIDSHKTCVLLGHPVGHSLSPSIHNAAFKALGIDMNYEAIDVEAKDIALAFDTVRDLGIRGVNLTTPLKSIAIPYLDELSEFSALTNSVNTIVNENGKLIGYSTDGRGFMDFLSANNINIKGHYMSVLGAGGAARSIIAQAAMDGLRHIMVFKRMNETFSETIEFAKKINAKTPCQVSIHDFADEEDFRSCLSASNLICNATTVGRNPNETIVPDYMLSKELITVDINYGMASSKLLSDASKKGAHTFDGKGMLLYQAAAAFKLWTGQEMPVDKIHI